MWVDFNSPYNVHHLPRTTAVSGLPFLQANRRWYTLWAWSVFDLFCKGKGTRLDNGEARACRCWDSARSGGNWTVVQVREAFNVARRCSQINRNPLAPKEESH